MISESIEDMRVSTWWSRGLWKAVVFKCSQCFQNFSFRIVVSSKRLLLMELQLTANCLKSAWNGNSPIAISKCMLLILLCMHSYMFLFYLFICLFWTCNFWLKYHNWFFQWNFSLMLDFYNLVYFTPFLQSTASSHSELFPSNQQPMDWTKSPLYIFSLLIICFTWMYVK